MIKYRRKWKYSFVLIGLMTLLLAATYIYLRIGGHTNIVFSATFVLPVLLTLAIFGQVKIEKLNNVCVNSERIIVKKQKRWESEDNTLKWQDVHRIKYEGKKLFIDKIKLVSETKSIKLNINDYKGYPKLIKYMKDKSNEHGFKVDEEILDLIL